MERLKPLELIVAVGRGGVIGSASGRLGLPWHIPEDLRHFRRTTTGRPIVMGRTTYETIGRPLPKRRNIVLSSKLPEADDIEVVRSLEEALEVARSEGQVPIVIGGAQVYAAALPLVTTIHWTEVDREVEGDTFFPELGAGFQEVQRRPGEEEDVVFRTLHRRRPRPPR